MAFNDEATKDGRGRALRVDVSLDDWATISYRYSDVAGTLDGTNWYEARVVNSPTVRRALGQNRIATSGQCELVLSNPDGDLDWLCGASSLATVSAVRCRIYVAIYDPATPTTFVSKLLGDFHVDEWPRQTNDTVTLSLADIFCAPLAQGALLPTIADWAAVGTPATNPLRAGAGDGLPSYGLPDTLFDDTPIQLAFGEDWLEALPHILPWQNSNYQGYVIVPMCVTLEASAAASTDITSIRVEGLDANDIPTLADIPRTYGDIVDGDWVPDKVAWTVEKSPAISKGGKTFYVLYAKVIVDLAEVVQLQDLRVSANGIPSRESEAAMRRHQFNGGYPRDAVSYAGDEYALWGSRVLRWYMKAPSFSALETVGPQQHAADIVIDLVEQYSPGSVTVGASGVTRVKGGMPFARVTGVVQGWREHKHGMPWLKPPTMRQVLTSLAQSADMDVFVTWDGNIGLASDVWDFTVAQQSTSLVTIPETRIDGVTRWVAGQGERGSPYNRVVFSDSRTYDAEHREAPFAGPFDFDYGSDGAHVPMSSRIIEMELSQSWRPWAQTALSPWYWRNIDSRARDRVSFTTGFDGLQLDLGDYFFLEWSSNRSAPYAGATVFQVESITYASGDDTVQIEAIWRDDADAPRYGYLLDDETLVVRSKGALTGDATPVGGGSAVVNFGGTINTTTMGVVAGDVLVLRDTGEAATTFTRNGAWRITVVNSTTQVTVAANGAAIYPSTATIANADWYVVRGATTYHTAVSDVTNYPSGGEMYGKTTDSSGNFSDATEGNRLING